MSKNLIKEHEASKRLGRDPLRVHVDAFERSLAEVGYASSTVRTIRWCLGDFGRWMQRSDVAVDDLDEGVIEAFLNERQRQGRLHRSHRSTVRYLLECLREQGIVRLPTPEATSELSPTAKLLRQYEQYLREERGLAEATAVGYRPYALRFVEERFSGQPLCLGELGPSPALRRSTPRPDDTGPTINSSPSWTASDYAESIAPRVQSSSRSEIASQHNPELGITSKGVTAGLLQDPRISLVAHTPLTRWKAPPGSTQVPQILWPRPT